MTAPFNKLDIIQCINKESNDPPNLVTCQYLINNGFQTILPIKVYKESAICYEDTLNKACFTIKLLYYSLSTGEQKQKSPTELYMV